MKSSLLSALRKYRPREDHDPLENFITEAFVWLLQNHPRFGEFILKKIALGLKLQFYPTGSAIEWTTQVHSDGLRPDMVAVTDGRAFVFEHKAWSHLREGQLQDYREQAIRKYGKENYHLILITAATHLIDQEPDLGFCWHEVHAWIKEWQSHPEYEEEFLFGDFCQLLENEGMGPPAVISHAAILSFLPAQNFLNKISDLIQRAAKYEWASLLPAGQCKVLLPGHRGCLWGDDKYGFFGFHLLDDGANWVSSISVGFFPDPKEYRIEWLDPSNPDFSINIDFNDALYPKYWRHPLYRQMIEELSQAVASAVPAFEFLDHLATCPEPNRWHPIHIRTPMLELLRGTRTADEQRKQLIEKTSAVLKLIKDCGPFWELREQLGMAGKVKRA